MFFKLEKQNMVLDGLPCAYPGYTHSQFYNHGHLAYFTKEVAMKIMKDLLASYEDRMVTILAEYWEDVDAFVYVDADNCEVDHWKGRKVLTVDGEIHLYQYGAGWMWDIEK